MSIENQGSPVRSADRPVPLGGVRVERVHLGEDLRREIGSESAFEHRPVRDGGEVVAVAGGVLAHGGSIPRGGQPSGVRLFSDAMGWRRGDEEKDLGLGSVVAQRSRERFLNKDGSFNVVRRGLPFLESVSPYHFLLTMSWTRFHAVLVGSYLLANAAFALAFLACGPAALEGAGTSAPASPARSSSASRRSPRSASGTSRPSASSRTSSMTAEALLGLLWVAMATGLLFARFSRPTAQILFSRSAVVAPYRGITALMFRVANGRTNQLIDLQARVMLGHFVTEDGRKVRKFDNLTLERAEVMFFPLSWTVVHPIDETSPLWGLDADGVRAADAELLILLSGIDETFSQTVHTRTSYKPDELVWNARFVGIFDSPKEGEHLAIDLRRLSEIEPLS